MQADTLYQIHSIMPAGADRITTLPILILNVHSNCNCLCMMCDIWQRTERIEFPVESLEPHRQSLRSLGVRWVVLTGGEPLMHRRLTALCAFFRELGIRLTLLTNGLLLYKHASEIITHFDDIVLSLDGPAQLHDQIRGIPGAFALIEKGITELRRIRPAMRITCRTTIQRKNRDSLRAIVRTAHSLGLDGISFLAVDLTSQAFNRAHTWPQEHTDTIAPTALELLELKEEMNRLIAECS